MDRMPALESGVAHPRAPGHPPGRRARVPRRGAGSRAHGTTARPRRRSALVVFVFQALLWIAGPTVEAWAEVRSLAATAHIEQEDSRACPPIHSHFDCQICRTLRTGATMSAPVTLPWRAQLAHGLAPARMTTGAQATAGGPHGARAPPVA